MKTKAEIVQDLLNEGKITAEDAVILLMDSRQKEYVYIPQPYPYNPYPPFFVDPFPFGTPPIVTWSDSSGQITLNVN